ncbi:hypothetical protein [Halobacterium zhouii]|uniref:hypothetical protein n=1 Tax=Halobacterium zhouii TaxID=2902624 RepID=UPI001E496A3A|nr:hypothetical protein [Halobacterium zhouii]
MAVNPRARRALTHPSVWVVFALLSAFWVVALVDIPDGSALLAVVRALALPGYLVVIAVNLLNAATLDLASTNPVLYLAILLAFYGVSVALGAGVRAVARRLS